ncbi:hypothetical protein DSUL_170031 [Desulfovibrionales bacterium]
MIITDTYFSQYRDSQPLQQRNQYQVEVKKYSEVSFANLELWQQFLLNRQRNISGINFVTKSYRLGIIIRKSNCWLVTALPWAHVVLVNLDKLRPSPYTPPCVASFGPSTLCHEPPPYHKHRQAVPIHVPL